jgi:hypothetical protein
LKITVANTIISKYDHQQIQSSANTIISKYNHQQIQDIYFISKYNHQQIQVLERSIISLESYHLFGKIYHLFLYLCGYHIIQRRDGGCASLRPGFLSKNYTRGDEDEALDWQTEGARPRQLVPPASDA